MQRSIVATIAGAITFGIAFVSPSPQAQNVTAPPLVRTGGDARGLTSIQLQQADVEVDVAGRLARTTLTLVLHNPNNRVLEGSLEFPLADGQQVTGFALDVGGAMREAVPVPKDKGRQVFESIERRGVDPGLLEQVAGNSFRLRVYPIPAKGERRVQLIIDESVGASGLTLPVQLLSGAQAFALRVHAAGVGRPAVTGAFVTGAFDDLRFEHRDNAWVADVRRGAFREEAPLRLRFPRADAKAAYVAHRDDGQRYVLGEVQLDNVSIRPRAIPKRIGLLWDASASADKRDRSKDYALLDRYFAAMGDGRATLRLLRDVGEDGGTFEIRKGDWTALRARLDAVVNDGATDLADWTPREEIDEYLLFSDGQRNYGEGDVPRLGARQRLYTIATAPSGNDTLRLAMLAQQRNGRLIDATGKGLLEEGLRIVGLAPHGVTDLEVPGRFVDDGLVRIAGRATQTDAHVDVTLDNGAGQRVVRVDLPASGPSHPQVAALWAGWKLRALSVDPQRNAAQIARIGQQFGVVTPGTSLLVLENADDYVRYDIPAPAELREVVAELQATRRKERAQNRSERLDTVAAKFAGRVAWWERKFPKDAPAAQKISDEGSERRRAEAPAAAAAVPLAAPPAQELDAVEVVRDGAINPIDVAALESTTILTAEQINKQFPVDRQARARSATVTLQPWQPDSPYARRLRDASPAQVYALYLDERDGNADSTAFYLDVADILLAKGRRAEGLRVLSNLAEMQLESRHVLRVLGYRLMQAKDDARAVEVFRKVLALADEEPQSHRDLGLALAGTGRRQESIERLYEVVARPWDGRFEDIELVALNELNAIVATSPKRLDTAFVDARLLHNLPVDLRAVLAWDSDNSDMDLWVTDPNGERCYYGNQLTWQGGRISDDFTGGYGPEEFLLRDAKPGKYRVEANFYGDRQQIVTGATTLTLTLTTGWGTPARKDQVVTMRLDDALETVLVGEFEVR